MSLSAGARLGPYEVLAPLGAGGMGEVYRARDTRLEREVAIKVSPAEVAAETERLRQFEKEARSASALNHPNIVTIHDIGTTGRRELWKTITPQDPAGIWTAELMISPDGKSYTYYCSRQLADLYLVEGLK